MTAVAVQAGVLYLLADVLALSAARGIRLCGGHRWLIHAKAEQHRNEEIVPAGHAQVLFLL
ncbi:hypothetical protein PSEUDO9AG_10181 [Pseudomonas sp. 9Ag]|nr:hypothetical protein PSEUDO9AG_10181 [Pseudomonas sp. 9Ag]